MRTLALTVLLLFSLAACNFGDNVSVQPGESGGLDISVSLSQTEVNQLIAEAIASNPDVPINDAQVDLQPGVLVITGNVEQQDGTTTPGSVTMSVGMGEGRVNVQVSSVNIAGFDANDPRIANLNQRISDVLNTRAQRDNTNAQITAVSVTDDTLNLTINVRRTQTLAEGG